MPKIPITAAGFVLLSSLLVGCGDGSSAYCDAVKKDAATLTNFTSPAIRPDFAKIPAFLADAKELQAKAPKAVADDWAVVTSELDSLTDALREAGLSYQQFATFLDSGRLPEGVTEARTTGLALQYQRLGADIVTRAANQITDHAARACKVDLTRKG